MTWAAVLQVLVEWVNAALLPEHIVVRSLEADVFDGLILHHLFREWLRAAASLAPPAGSHHWPHGGLQGRDPVPCLEGPQLGGGGLPPRAELGPAGPPWATCLCSTDWDLLVLGTGLMSKPTAHARRPPWARCPAAGARAERSAGRKGQQASRGAQSGPSPRAPRGLATCPKPHS